MVAATLSSLPTEIKTKIATLCHEQDRDFKTLLQRIQTRRDVDSDTFLIRELAIPTLTALSVLSHEWNVLTAPIRFQVSKQGHRVFEARPYRSRCAEPHSPTD